MSEQPDSRWTPDDAMARQSGAVSEDVQPVGDEDTDKTAQGLPEGAPGARRMSGTDGVETE